MGDINKHCPMCGARPGERCKVISGDPEAAERPGDWRSEPHFYRHNDEPISVLIPDEPPRSAAAEGLDRAAAALAEGTIAEAVTRRAALSSGVSVEKGDE